MVHNLIPPFTGDVNIDYLTKEVFDDCTSTTECNDSVVTIFPFVK